MNLILHQFKTDLRHFRWPLLLLWLSFAAEPVLTSMHSMPEPGIEISRFLVIVWQAFFAIGIVVALVQADALTGTGAAWLARPVRRAHLFWAKTAFIVVCVIVPRLILQSIDWALRGYSMQLGLAAAGESLLFGITFLLIAAVLAALTRNLALFFLAAGIMIGGIFAWAMAVEMLVRAGMLHHAHLGLPSEGGRDDSALAMAWLILAAGTFAAWITQARMGSWRSAVLWLAAGLLAYPVITTISPADFLEPRLVPSAPLTVSLVQTNRPLNEEPGQFLTSELMVSGVPAGEVAVVHEAFATILFNGDTKVTLLPQAQHTSYPRRTRPVESPQAGNYFATIRDFFPADTLWFNDRFISWVGSAFDDKQVFPRFSNRPPAGKLDGTVTLDVFGVKKAAEVPLRSATFMVMPGLSVTVQRVRLADGIIGVSLDECVARLMFNRDATTADPGGFSGSEPFCTYVLYHPGSGEAFVVSQANTQEEFPIFLSGEGHLGLELSFPYPALRERMTGVSAADWLREARLCVFVPVYAGTSSLGFHEEHYLWPWGYDGNLRRQKEQLEGAKAIAQAALPANPTAAELDAYLDTILLNVPDGWDNASRKTITTKLEAIGVNGLPALLRRLPLGESVENGLVFPAIAKLITRDQLPELRAALERDDNVVEVFRRKHWEADARDELVAKLPDHRLPLRPSALRIAAEAKDPATYADLRWHFVHLRYGQDDVIGALEQCPGFDSAAAVREAWQYARLGVTDTGDLAAIAARQGLPDALSLAVTHVADARDEETQQRWLAQVASLTGYNGPTNNALPWLIANLDRFRYDAAQQRYVLGDAR
jgi:hypothetical protein